jgi:hypothetical protein
MAFHVFISTKLIKLLPLNAKTVENEVPGNMFKVVLGILLLLIF